ncbi:tetratricopeptide repeat protein [Streptomyces sp. OE57]|uniref:tetratricopeptide repeat protein n=1 Tax=Streptomyces lacaronensis TaxID=3379885 RepID=UPI0039B73BC0
MGLGVGSPATLRFRVPGPVRDWRGSELLSTGSPQQRALLAALPLHDRLGDEPATPALAECRYALGLALLRTEHTDEALEQLDQALAVLHRVGGDRRRADVLLVLGGATDGTGESARARTCWAEALARYEDVPREESAEPRERLRSRLDNAAAHDGTSHLTDT